MHSLCWVSCCRTKTKCGMQLYSFTAIFSLLLCREFDINSDHISKKSSETTNKYPIPPHPLTPQSATGYQSNSVPGSSADQASNQRHSAGGLQVRSSENASVYSNRSYHHTSRTSERNRSRSRSQRTDWSHSGDSKSSRSRSWSADTLQEDGSVDNTRPRDAGSRTTSVRSSNGSRSPRQSRADLSVDNTRPRDAGSRTTSVRSSSRSHSSRNRLQATSSTAVTQISGISRVVCIYNLLFVVVLLGTVKVTTIFYRSVCGSAAIWLSWQQEKLMSSLVGPIEGVYGQFELKTV